MLETYSNDHRLRSLSVPKFQSTISSVLLQPCPLTDFVFFFFDTYEINLPWKIEYTGDRWSVWSNMWSNPSDVQRSYIFLGS